MLEPVIKKQTTIIRGEDKTITVSLKKADDCKECKDPLDLTGVSEIEAAFLNNDGTILTKRLTTSGVVLVSAVLGKFQIILTAAETLLLRPSPTVDGIIGFSGIEIKFVLAGKTTILNIPDSIQVINQLYP